MAKSKILIAFLITTIVLTITTSISAKKISGGTAKSSCPSLQIPDSGEGPFFLPDQPVRSDIREGSIGIPLTLNIKVTNEDSTSCSPLKNASVHIWQANASGIYSAYLGYYPVGQPGSKPMPPSGMHSEPTDNTTFLRGIQYTNENGEVTFKTIYPGWYHGRSLHLHFKIIAEDGIQKLVGEFYFPEDITDMVATVEPYSQNKEQRTKNEVDRKFTKYEGESSMTKPEGNVKSGFRSTILIRVKA